MQEKGEKYSQKRAGITRENQDKILHELETRIIALTSAEHGALSRKTMEEIEKIVDKFYEEWENEFRS